MISQREFVAEPLPAKLTRKFERVRPTACRVVRALRMLVQGCPRRKLPPAAVDFALVRHLACVAPAVAQHVTALRKGLPAALPVALEWPLASVRPQVLHHVAL
jgi:hypothetical protein